jgi:hypothetical protein
MSLVFEMLSQYFQPFNLIEQTLKVVFIQLFILEIIQFIGFNTAIFWLSFCDARSGL